MKNIFNFCLIFILSACASVFSHSVYPVNIHSTPAGVPIVITEHSTGVTVFDGTTPANLNLDASSGFFQKAKYRVTFKKEGYAEVVFPISPKVDGWFIASILLTGFVGIVVDGASGAMYKLEGSYFVNMSKLTSNLNKKDLRIYAIEEVPDHLRKHLVKIN